MRSGRRWSHDPAGRSPGERQNRQQCHRNATDHDGEHCSNDDQLDERESVLARSAALFVQPCPHGTSGPRDRVLQGVPAPHGRANPTARAGWGGAMGACVKTCGCRHVAAIRQDLLPRANRLRLRLVNEPVIQVGNPARFFRSSREHHRFPDEAPGRTADVQPRWQWCHGQAFWCLNQGELRAN